MTDKILDMAAAFERRAKTPTNLMTMDEFLFAAKALRELAALRDERRAGTPISRPHRESGS